MKQYVVPLIIFPNRLSTNSLPERPVIWDAEKFTRAKLPQKWWISWSMNIKMLIGWSRMFVLKMWRYIIHFDTQPMDNDKKVAMQKRILACVDIFNKTDRLSVKFDAAKMKFRVSLSIVPLSGIFNLIFNDAKFNWKQADSFLSLAYVYLEMVNFLGLVSKCFFLVKV
jgi:hypothetical protein